MYRANRPDLSTFQEGAADEYRELSAAQRRRLLAALEILLPYLMAGEDHLREGGDDAGNLLPEGPGVPPKGGDGDADRQPDGGVQEGSSADADQPLSQLPLFDRGDY